MTWSKVSLEEVADEITVGFVGSMAEEYIDKGVLFFRSLNIEPYRINFNDIRYISENFHKKIKKSTLRPGDVVIVRTGKPGTCAVVPESIPEANCSDLVIVRPGKNLNSRFLAYYINSAAAQHVASHLVGAVQQHFNIGSARVMQLDLPTLPEQRAIAHVLGSLDDKIELNRQMNETLEEMARTLFRSWFVDFDPVHAKAAGRQPEGMDAETAALFPSEFVESELGMIPKGWDAKPIGECVQAVGGGTPKTAESEYWEGGTIHWATPKDLSSLSSPVLLGTERQITEVGLKQISSGLLPVGTVLLSSRAPIGYLVISEVPVAVNQGFIAMVCNGPLPNHYVLHWAKANMETIEGRANGSTFMEISKSAFRPIPAIVPSGKVLTAFVEQVDPLYRQVVRNLQETQTLIETRESLLPKLISGEIRLPEDMIAEFEG